MDRALSIAVQQHFDGIASAYYGVVDKVWYDVGYYHQEEADFLRKSLPHAVNLAIDAGCGPGRHIRMLSKSAQKVIAVDFSRGMLLQARASNQESDTRQVDFIQADVRSLPLRDESADFVLNMEVLEHLPGKERDAAVALVEFERVLRPSGLLVAEAPLRVHTWWRLICRKTATFKEVSKEEKEKYYVQSPLVVDYPFKEVDIDQALLRAGFGTRKKRFIRFFPSGLVERYPSLGFLDALMERLPLLRHFCREAIWCVHPTRYRSEARS